MAVDASGNSTINDFVKDEEKLLRLIWSNKDLTEEGYVTPSAIDKRDISGERSFSVNREKLVKKETVQALLERQKKSGLGYHGDLGIPYITRIITGNLRSIKREGEQVFEVYADPTQPTEDLPANDAHAVVKSKEKITAKSILNEIRASLVELMDKPVTFEQYFQNSS